MDKPEPIDLVDADGETIATACVKTPPTNRNPDWYWQATYTNPETGRRANTALGRCPVESVGERLRDKMVELLPGRITDDGSGIRTLDALVRGWYAWQETRGSDGSRQVSDATVTAYRSNARRLIPYVRGIECRTMSEDGYRTIRERMDAKAPRRTVNADMKALNQAMIWARRKGVAIPTFATKGTTTLPVDDGHRVNNHHTPSHEDVALVYSNMRTTPARLAVYLAWKTGARIHEVCEWAPDKGRNGTRGPGLGLPVDRDGQCWIYFPHRKNGSGGKFPITSEDRETILSLIPKKWKPGRPWCSEHLRRNVTGTLACACTRLGVTPFSPHGLRRLMDDTMLRRGVELGTYAKLMNHSAETALRNYRRPTDDDLAGALAKINSQGEELHKWLTRHGLTEDDALVILERALREDVSRGQQEGSAVTH